MSPSTLVLYGVLFILAFDPALRMPSSSVASVEGENRRKGSTHKDPGCGRRYLDQREGQLRQPAQQELIEALSRAAFAAADTTEAKSLQERRVEAPEAGGDALDEFHRGVVKQLGRVDDATAPQSPTFLVCGAEAPAQHRKRFKRRPRSRSRRGRSARRACLDPARWPRPGTWPHRPGCRRSARGARACTVRSTLEAGPESRRSSAGTCSR